MKISLNNFVIKKNKKKFLFTPGPTSLSLENLVGLEACFGRGDNSYKKIQEKVLSKLKKLSGHKKIITLQGSGSLAIEIMCKNFLSGNVVVVNTGYYSDRVLSICKNLVKEKIIKNLFYVKWNKMNNFKAKKKISWVIGCPTETSKGLLVPIVDLKKFARNLNAKMMLDATASIGLEENHKLAQVISYSSCKGLCGLTGASFVAYNLKPKYYKNSFYTNIFNHEQKKMTGPYHSILSLYNVLKNYKKFKQAILNNKKKFLKKFGNYLIYKKINQPNICTFVTKKIKSKNKKVVLYQPRSSVNGSIISHLGEVHLKNKAKGKILNYLY